jgi:hypothetical protein
VLFCPSSSSTLPRHLHHTPPFPCTATYLRESPGIIPEKKLWVQELTADKEELHTSRSNGIAWSACSRKITFFVVIHTVWYDPVMARGLV